jgi:membrane-bound ClpP family serine protease
MLNRHWKPYISSFLSNPWVRGIFLVLYYLAIIVGLILMYGRGNFSTPPFVYQGF